MKLSKFAYQFVQLGLSVEEAMNESNQPQGMVRLSMHESFFVTRMSPPVQQFKNNFPKVKFRVEPGFDHFIIDQVLQHAVDFGFLPRNPQRDDFHFHPLIEEELVFIGSNALTEKFESKGLSILNEETVLSFGNSCLYHTHAHQVLKEAGIEGNSAIQIPSIEMLKQAVKCGMGFALIPVIAAKKELENGEIKALPLRPGIFSSHGLVVNKDRELSLPATLFKSHILEYFSSLKQIV
ncbi:substrate-binding domain-containing protein [Paenibacillus psychroresistens]|uniref:substrate-binding domain-containing protein n=1 Tax=Paenibacillus psychroresistens TaxID=1778678 RepID=UPI0012DA86BD|nr:substrate-binding domain-containing protein [Paenibacillus psychroresistens]